MAVKIRLTRRGRKKRAMYDVIVADARSPRDGRLIDKLGTYNPLSNPASILIDEDKALEWLLKGAQPTDTARRILSHKGIMLKKHLQIGVLKGAITQEQADKKFEEWLKGKESEITSKVDSLQKKKVAEAKAKHEAEVKVKEAKAEALRQKLAALVPAEEATEETVAEEGDASEDAPVAEVVVEEAPVEEEEKVEEPKAEAKEDAIDEVQKVADEIKEATEETKVEEVKAEAEEVSKEVVAEPTAIVEDAPATEEKKAEEVVIPEAKDESKEEASEGDEKEEEKK